MTEHLFPPFFRIEMAEVQHKALRPHKKMILANLAGAHGASAIRRAGRTLVSVGLILLACTFVGCASTSLGIRPDEPAFSDKTKTACDEYIGYRIYVKSLEEAYHSRATQNRSWVYGSGATALGTVAAGAIMAASSVSAGTIGIVSVSGGLASGLFALADNSTLAQIYTTAANRLETGVQEAEAMLTLNNTTRYSDADCTNALRHLRLKVSIAKNDLEQARTDSAAASVQRAIAQNQQFKQSIAAVREQEVAQANQDAIIMGITPSKLDAAQVKSGDAQDVTLKVAKADFVAVGIGDLKVDVGGETRVVSTWAIDSNSGDYMLTFKAPATPPVAGQNQYVPQLLIGKAQTTIRCKPGVFLTYP